MARYGIWSPIPRTTGGVTKWGSRYGTAPVAVVIHRIEGTLNGAESWLKNPASGAASTHFGLGYNNYLDRLLRRNVQVRQWVDTSNAAYGWAASPTDIPTPAAQRVLGKYLYARTYWPYYASRIDLNRLVIAIEVEGHHDKPFDPRFIPPLKALLAWIAQTHGPLWVLLHTDCSVKPCPGAGFFKAAMPGYYGARLSTGIPDTSFDISEAQEMALLAATTVSGDVGREFDVKAGTVLRKGPGTNYAMHYKVPVRTFYRLIGEHSSGWFLAAPREGRGMFWVPPAH